MLRQLMGVLSNLTRRFWSGIRPEIELDSGGGGGGPVRAERPPAPPLQSEEQRRKLDACNQALPDAAAGARLAPANPCLAQPAHALRRPIHALRNRRTPCAGQSMPRATGARL